MFLLHNGGLMKQVIDSFVHGFMWLVISVAVALIVWWIVETFGEPHR